MLTRVITAVTYEARCSIASRSWWPFVTGIMPALRYAVRPPYRRTAA